MSDLILPPKREAQRGLYTELREQGLLEYGSIIPLSLVHKFLGIVVPDVGTKADFDKLSLLELAAIDYVRNILLGEGKYLTGSTDGYRILLPSENATQVEQYISSADKKLSRALKLSRNSPHMQSSLPDQIEARILMKQTSFRRPHATP